MDTKKNKKRITLMQNSFESTEIFHLMSPQRRVDPISPPACGLAEMNYLLLLYFSHPLAIYSTTSPIYGPATLLEKTKPESCPVKIGTNTQLILTEPLTGTIIPPKDSIIQKAYRPLFPKISTSLFFLFDLVYLSCELPIPIKVRGFTHYLDTLLMLMKEKNVPVDEQTFIENSIQFGAWIKQKK